MTDRELLELAAKAAALVGTTRFWTPSYPGAQPRVCTVFTCAVTASFTRDGMSASIGPVWTNYSDSGRLERVWFTLAEWLQMPVEFPGAAIASTGSPT